jgi:hypothetical protein
MAKESMKAREVKRAKLVAKYAEKRKAFERSWRLGLPLTSSQKTPAPADFTTVARSPVVPRVICVNLALAVFSSVRWLPKALYRE